MHIMPDCMDMEAPSNDQTDERHRPAPKRIGMLAGWGSLPIVVAKSLKANGHSVHCLGYYNHADPKLAQICDSYDNVGICRFGKKVRYFRRHGVTHATMVGKLFKTHLFEKYGWIKNLPDLLFWRYYYPHFISRRENRADDTLLTTATTIFSDRGITMVPATDLVPTLIMKEGTLTRRQLTPYQISDIQYGWQIAKEMGRLDIGQTVAVKGRAVIAVEAVEGTDDCIRRAGQLCSSGGFTIIKVAKPNQDMRFDVPTIGVGTLKTIQEAGAAVLAVEADKTILLDREQVQKFADRYRITVVAINPNHIPVACQPQQPRSLAG
jgi:UDP-2,3-diacylglucosamine hydrolase